MFNPFRSNRHPTSEQIAAAIAPLALDDSPSREVAQQLDLPATDTKRFLFSVVILTLDLAVCWGTFKRSVRGKEIDIGALIYACRLALERIPNVRADCRLGDFTLCVAECGGLAGILRQEPHIKIKHDAFDDTVLPFFDLAVSLFACRLPQVIKICTDDARLFSSDADRVREAIVLDLSNLLLEQASLEPLRVSPLSTPSSDLQITLLILSSLVTSRYIEVMKQMAAVYNT